VKRRGPSEAASAADIADEEAIWIRQESPSGH
jgi:hypothetical protein